MFVFVTVCLLITIFTGIQSNSSKEKSYSELNSCDLGPLAEEIAAYSNVVRNIVEYTVNGPFRGKTYDELSKFVDTFGARPSGSQALEDSIDYMIQLTREENISNIITEELELYKSTHTQTPIYQPNKLPAFDVKQHNTHPVTNSSQEYNCIIIPIRLHFKYGHIKCIEGNNRNMFVFVTVCLLITIFTGIQSNSSKEKSYSELNSCDLGPLAEEIAAYSNVVRNIVEYTVNGPFRGKTYDELSKFVDTFGARPSGSQALEDSIDYMIQLTREENISNIITEELEVPHWTRVTEELTMLEPRIKNIDLLGLGLSSTTVPEGITAEVIVVKSFNKLSQIPNKDIEGKIVLFDPIFTSYNETVIYRIQGAVKAAEKGAVASLVRSITPFSINTLHTGAQSYSDNVKKIPSAAISLEDADLIRRLFNRGTKIVLNIKMASVYESKISRNTFIDLKGTSNPEKMVIVSGHIDSWDVGQGAMDDGGGLFVSWAAPVILKRLNLIPKRTIRSIFWTAEEFGLIGAYAYEKAHRNESHNINFIMESDEGTFAPRGLAVGGTQQARCIIAEILKLFESINASTVVEQDSPGSDISIIIKTGIPGASLLNANEKYFWFHHTEGDTMNVESPEELDLCTAFWTAVAYIIANISTDIPR